MSEPIETMWEGRFIVARREGKWEYVGRARGIKAAVLLAIDDAADGRHVLLVQQWRVPLKAHTIELPAGLVGDETENEHPEDAASRELEEETGYRAGHIEVVGSFASSPGMVSETFTLMKATRLEKVGDGGGVDGEDIVVHRVPIDGIASFIAEKRTEGMVIDVKLLLLLGPLLLA